MNTLNTPRPQEFQPHELAPPQDPWAEAQITTDEPSGDLAPLPNMTPQEEVEAFDGIVQEFQATKVVDQVDAQGNAIPTPAANPEDTYTPRHLRLRNEPFTPTPISDHERRTNEQRKATLALRETLRKVEPELLQEAKSAMPGEATEQIMLPTPEQPAEQPAAPTAETERPANYRSRHRMLGRFARLFGR